MFNLLKLIFARIKLQKNIFRLKKRLLSSNFWTFNLICNETINKFCEFEKIADHEGKIQEMFDTLGQHSALAQHSGTTFSFGSTLRDSAQLWLNTLRDSDQLWLNTLWDSDQLWLNTLRDSGQLWLNTHGTVLSFGSAHSRTALSFSSTHSGTALSFGSTHYGTELSFGSTHYGTELSFGLTHSGQHSALAQHTPRQRFSSAHSGIALCFGSRLSCTGLSSAWLNTGPWQRQCNRVQIVLEFLWQTSPKQMLQCTSILYIAKTTSHTLLRHLACVPSSA